MRKLIIPAVAMTIIAFTPLPASALDNVNSKKFRDGVTVAGILAHERALQRIANDNDGTRASGTPGYLASANYVAKTLRDAGYSVRRQEFTFPFYRELAPAQLTQVSPTPTTYETGTYTFSGTGDVTGKVVPTNDLVIPAGPVAGSSNSGCEASDFTPADPVVPQIALIQRGTCFFQVKAENAIAAGYDAVIFFNEGQPGRQDLFIGSMSVPFNIPAVGLSYADGVALNEQIQAGTVNLRVVTSTELDANRKTWNIIADSPGGDANKTIVVGAHLDSVIEGPGINDNGSGTATNLEIAEQLTAQNVKLRQKVRFAFWGAEELGTIGSEYYVNNLSDAAFAKIYANLNFDMVGSPNYVRFVYDGDGSGTGTAGPPGSAEIEGIFNDYFASQGLASAPTAFDGRSDYGAFITAGIPAGGLFSGAEGVKTPEQAAVYGGQAGVAYDVCYHQACDTTVNLNANALNELGDAAAHAVLTLGVSKTGLFPDGSLRARRAPATLFSYKGGQAVR